MTAEWNRLRSCLPQPPAWGFDWAGLRAFPPLAEQFDAMARTPQTLEWHGEGDVWTHTRMVCEALAGMSEFRAMQDQSRDALALAALLHDMGKPRCTRRENGQWVSPRHGPTGAHMARSLLWREFGLCGRDDAMRFREAVCLLIRYHTRPLHLMDGKAPTTQALKLAANGELSPGFTLNALCLLSKADVLGRIAPDTREQLDAVELSGALAQETGCADGPYAFLSPRTERALFCGANVWRDQELYDDAWGEITLMCGLPGTGKDTWIRKNRPGLPVVSLDDLRADMGVSPADNQGHVVQAAREQAKALLRAKRPFVWNATSLTGLRAQQVELFERYRARVRIVYLETKWDENLRRNADRAAAVPEEVIGRMLDRLEPPERWEAQEIEWICV